MHVIDAPTALIPVRYASAAYLIDCLCPTSFRVGVMLVTAVKEFLAPLQEVEIRPSNPYPFFLHTPKLIGSYICVAKCQVKKLTGNKVFLLR
jgi:hypothetical protein